MQALLAALATRLPAGEEDEEEEKGEEEEKEEEAAEEGDEGLQPNTTLPTLTKEEEGEGTRVIGGKKWP